MPKYLSLFRAINVGGNNPVKMPALKAMHEDLGFRNVLTYLQTGNVIFETEQEREPQELAGRLEREFETRFGFRSLVLVRTPAELEAVVARNPFRERPGLEPKWLLVMFLAGRPDERAGERLAAAYQGPEDIWLGEQELYIYYGEGIGRSKLSGALVEKALGAPATGRNWNTVTKLLELLKD